MQYNLKIRHNVVLTSHPIGMKKFVDDQIDYIKSQPKIETAKNAVVIGAGSGYGLASRIALAFGSNTHTLGITYSGKPRNKKYAPDYLGSVFFKQAANKDNIPNGNLFGDAFSNEMKDEVIAYIKENMEGGKLDLLVYSVAAGRRKDPETGEVYNSSLKALDKPFKGYTVDVDTKELKPQELGIGNEEELEKTIKVMGGEDLELWVNALYEAGVLAEGFKVITYSYVGTPITFPIYKDGTIGQAKRHLETTIANLNSFLKDKLNGEAIVTSSKAVITKASVFIPTLPIYASSLYKVMMEQGTHETPIMHKYRMFKDMVYGDKAIYDEDNIMRVDHFEIEDKVQNPVKEIMSKVTPENYLDILDIDSFINEVIKLNGFGYEGIDYEADVDVETLLGEDM